MNSKTLNYIMILFGVFLIVAYAQIYNNISDTKSDEARACDGIYTIGVMSLTIGLTLLMCPEQSITNTAVVVMMMVLGLVLTTLGGIVVSKAHDGPAKTWAVFVLLTGLLFIVGGGYAIYSAYRSKSVLSYGCGMY